jgi:hypothetical protein
MRRIPVIAVGVCTVFASSANAQRSPFDASRVTARTDSFVVSVAGNPAGFMTEQVTRDRDAFRLRNTTQIGQRMSQTTDVTLSATLDLMAVKQTGQVGPAGARMSIDVAVTKGHAAGSATTPGPNGMTTVSVDVQLPSGAVDDNALQFLLSTATLAAGVKHEVELFSSGKGEIKRVVLSVGERQSVTVPAGTFEAYRVRLDGGAAPVVFWVATVPLQRVVKVAIEGSPMEFQLVR